MTVPRVLVAGVGNIFFGDDAFGVEVVRRLAGRPWPDGVRVVDFGIRGLDLAYALLDGYDAVILVDATPRGRPAGTLYVINPDLKDLSSLGSREQGLTGHGMDPVRVFRLALEMGGQLPWVRVVGCEPAFLGSEEEPAMGLSEPVEAAMDEAIRLIETLVRQVLPDGVAHDSN
jgi:hydrogenase maturation protease